MDPEALANRIVNYCDGVVAFALINSFAFLAALAEPDIRRSIGGQPFLYAGALGSASVETAILLVLRRAELALRGGSEAGLTAPVQRMLRYLRIARIALVWAAAAVVIGLGTLVAFEPLTAPR